MKKQSNKVVLSLATSLILTNSIYAQDIKQLNTLTVTAQKTEENIQDVPISISLFDEFDLDDKMLNTVSDIAKFTPGLDVINYGSALKYAPSIRGLYSDYSSLSSTAGLYVDGIPVTAGTGFDETLMDIQRVEVLKGPQGTLYGKNAEAGVINIITKKPNNETKSKIITTAGSDNKRELAFLASGALVKDKFYVGISGKHYEKDGFVTNVNTGEIVDDREHNYGKIIFRYTPRDDFEVSLISSKIKYNDGANSLGRITENRNVDTDLKDTYNKAEVLLNALNVNYNINDKLKLSSTTAHRNYKEIQSNDFDFSSNAQKQWHSFSNSQYKTLSEELKLNYHNNNLQLVSGLFLEKGNVDFNKRIEGSSFTRNSIHTIDSKALGVFSHINYKINDKLSLLGGLRYDRENKEYKDSKQTIDKTWSQISPKIGLTYNIEENLMTYTTISQGYRAGGFNSYAPSGYSKTFDEESLYSYEIGLKGSALNGRLSYSTALYYMDITDMQVDVSISQTQHTRQNAAEATSKGIESSLKFQATDTISLFGGFSYNDITFDKYNDGKADYSGKRTTYSPKHSYHLGIAYRALNGYYANVNLSGYGDTYLDFANKYKRDSYNVVNTKIGYETQNYDIYLYANNLFDKEYDLKGVYGGYYTSYSPPREIGIQLAYRF